MKPANEPSSVVDTAIQEKFTIIVKHAGQEYSTDCLFKTDKVLDLKGFLYSLTNVLPEHQKLLGLQANNGPVTEETLLSEVVIPKSNKIMLMGTPSDVIQKILEGPGEVPDVVDDFDFEEREIAICHRPEYLQKVQRRCESYKITQLNPPREGKKLLVLDIDYTIYDHRSTAQSVRELMRPYLYEFLTQVYPFYDIIIWSATSMRWIEAKIREMGLWSASTSQEASLPQPQTTSPESSELFRVCALIDYGAMISVYLPGRGIVEVKPLQVIWSRYPQWSPENTIMIDDIRRNFLMNPQSGLRIEPYRNCHTARDTDRVLLQLADYLTTIHVSNLAFSVLKHRKWKQFLQQRQEQSPQGRGPRRSP